MFLISSRSTTSSLFDLKETEKSHCVTFSLLVNWNNITSVTNPIKLISCLFPSKILAHLNIYIHMCVCVYLVLVSTIGNYIHIHIYNFYFEKVYDQKLFDMFEDNKINLRFKAIL